mmetsp:Transcript_133098/g.332250  ORF Transcript_133098/g.332250 Transcript_133098/m.332250 type:complete len:224 (+) Transcript_133098:144-815(+)
MQPNYTCAARKGGCTPRGLLEDAVHLCRSSFLRFFSSSFSFLRSLCARTPYTEEARPSSRFPSTSPLLVLRRGSQTRRLPPEAWHCTCWPGAKGPESAAAADPVVPDGVAMGSHGLPRWQDLRPHDVHQVVLAIDPDDVPHVVERVLRMHVAVDLASGLGDHTGRHRALRNAESIADVLHEDRTVPAKATAAFLRCGIFQQLADLQVLRRTDAQIVQPALPIH